MGWCIVTLVLSIEVPKERKEKCSRRAARQPLPHVPRWAADCSHHTTLAPTTAPPQHQRPLTHPAPAGRPPVARVTAERAAAAGSPPRSPAARAAVGAGIARARRRRLAARGRRASRARLGTLVE